jgi:hypothetical protein
MFKGSIVTWPDCAGPDCAGSDCVGPDCAGPDRICTCLPISPTLRLRPVHDEEASLFPNGCQHVIYDLNLLAGHFYMYTKIAKF